MDAIGSDEAQPSASEHGHGTGAPGRAEREELAAKRKRITRSRPTRFGTKRNVRFSASEVAAVDAARSEIAKAKGVDASKVSFSEGLRLLLKLDEGEAANTVSIALGVHRRSASDERLTDEAREAFLAMNDELTVCRRQLVGMGANLNQIAKALNRVAAHGGSLDAEAADAVSLLPDALAHVAAMQDYLESIETKAFLAIYGGEDGAPDGGSTS